MKRFTFIVASGTAKRASKRATLQTVAQAAGVAVATASYALAGRKRGGRISPAVVVRVQRAAQKLGYAPSRAARALVSGRSRTVAVVLAGSRDAFSHSIAQVLDGIQHVLVARDYNLLLHGAGAELLADCATLLARRQADATLVLSAKPPATASWSVAGQPAPLWLDLMQAGGWQPAVQCDPAPGLQAAVAHLVELGHRDFLWLHPASTGGVAEARQAAVAASVAAAGSRLRTVAVQPLPSAFYDVSAQPVTDPVALVAAVLPWEELPTAILCWNDRLAFAAREALVARGVRVPGEVSVVGYDDFIAGWTVPPLSTVHAAFREIGETGAAWALRLATEPGMAVPEILRVPSRFIARATTGPAREKE